MGFGYNGFYSPYPTLNPFPFTRVIRGYKGLKPLTLYVGTPEGKIDAKKWRLQQRPLRDWGTMQIGVRVIRRRKQSHGRHGRNMILPVLLQ